MKSIAFLLGITLLFVGMQRASALDIYIGGGVFEHQAGGHFETRWERVTIEPAHYEDRLIPAVTETRVDADGKPYVVIVIQAHMERFYIPAKTEDVQVTVWVDDDGGYCYHHRGVFYGWGHYPHYRRHHWGGHGGHGGRHHHGHGHH